MFIDWQKYSLLIKQALITEINNHKVIPDLFRDLTDKSGCKTEKRTVRLSLSKTRAQRSARHGSTAHHDIPFCSSV